MVTRDGNGVADRVGHSMADDIHGRALRRFDEAYTVQQDQRDMAMACRRFVSIPGAQWEGNWGDPFINSIRVEIPKIENGLRKVYGDYTQARIIPDFRPDGKEADDDTAELLDGLHRADNAKYKSQEARDNAVWEAITGGFGAYRLANVLEDEYDKDGDHQRINPADVIVDADQRVFFDPQSVRYDKSDARYAFVREVYTRDAYRDTFDSEPQSDWPDTRTRPRYDWFSPDTVTVCEYYEVEDRREPIYVFTRTLDQLVERVWETDLDDGELERRTELGWTNEVQQRRRRRVKKYVLDGAGVLEDGVYIAGPRVPIVPVYGNRTFIDGVERFRGYVYSHMDGQRLLNSMASRLAETTALAPRERPIFAAEQMPPAIANLWDRGDIDRHKYAIVEPLRNPDGSIAIAGPIGNIKPPDVSPTEALLLQFAQSNLDEAAADGADTVKANTSAMAMDIAATRTDAKSALYLDNVRQSVQCEGEIYLGMAIEVYVEEGREVETMTADEGSEMATLGMVVNDGGVYKATNDLSKGRYKVTVSVQEATATLRDKAVRNGMAMAEIAMTVGAQDIALAGLLLAIENADGEGASDMKALGRRKGLEIGLYEPNDEEKKAAAEASQSAQPDPMAMLAQAQATEFQANAMLKTKQAEKTEAETAKTLMQTREIAATMATPRIRLGRDLGR